MNKIVHNAGIVDYKSLAGRKFGIREFDLDFLAVTFGGRAFFLLEEERISHSVEPVNFVYVPAGERHIYDPDIKSVWQNCWILFDGRAAGRAFGHLIPAPGITEISSMGRLTEYWETLSASMLDDNELNRERAFCMLHNILLELRIRSGAFTEKSPSPAIMETIRFMEENVRKPELNFTHLANKNGICPESLRKRFKLETGISLHQYFIQLKINVAKSMLSGLTYNIGDLADFLGFEDKYYFSRLFRKKTGQSPSGYRNSLVSGRKGREQ
jgi:AraC-like DNA-binding protein